MNTQRSFDDFSIFLECLPPCFHVEMDSSTTIHRGWLNQQNHLSEQVTNHNDDGQSNKKEQQQTSDTTSQDQSHGPILWPADSNFLKLRYFWPFFFLTRTVFSFGRQWISDDEHGGQIKSSRAGNNSQRVDCSNVRFLARFTKNVFYWEKSRNCFDFNS